MAPKRLIIRHLDPNNFFHFLKKNHLNNIVLSYWSQHINVWVTLILYSNRLFKIHLYNGVTLGMTSLLTHVVSSLRFNRMIYIGITASNSCLKRATEEILNLILELLTFKWASVSNKNLSLKYFSMKMYKIFCCDRVDAKAAANKFLRSQDTLQCLARVWINV